MRKRLDVGGMTTVPASRQNIEQRTPSGVRPIGTPIVPVKSDVQGAMKHGGELKKMKNSVKRMAGGGKAGAAPGQLAGSGGGMPMGGGQGKGGAPGVPAYLQDYAGRVQDRSGQGKGSGPGAGGMPMGGGQGKGGKGSAPGQGMGPGAGGMPMGGGQGKGPIPGMGRVPGGFMGGGAGQGQGKGSGPGMGPGAGGMPIGPGGPKGPGMRYPMGPGAGGMPMGGGMGDAIYGGKISPQYMQGPGPGGSFFGAPLDGPQAVQQSRPPGMKKGGKVSASTYNDMTGGAAGGIGRLEKSSIAAKTKSQKLKKGGKVKRMADGGLSAGDVYAMTGKYGPSVDDTGRRDAALRAYQARQDAAEKSPPTPRPRPKAFNPEFGSREDQAAKIKDIGRKVAARNAMANGALSNDAPIPEFDNVISRNTVPFIRDNGGNFSSGAYAKRRADAGMNPDEGMRRGGKAKMAKGGKAEAFEGSPKDMAQDKKLAKKRGMSFAAWERSPEDTKHDTQENMKGLKKGGHVKGCQCMACGGMAKKMAKGGDSSGFSPMAPIVKTARSRGISPYRFAGPQLGTGARRYAAKGGMVEDSPTEERLDKRQAKKSKMSMAKFENSGKDVDKMAKGGKVHSKGCKCMACGGAAKYASGGMSTAQDGMKGALRSKPSAMAKGGKVGLTFGKPLPGTKVSSQKIRSTVSTAGANMKKDGMKGKLRAKASGAKTSSMMKPMGMTKMASGGKVRGAGIAQRGTKFIGEV